MNYLQGDEVFHASDLKVLLRGVEPVKGTMGRWVWLLDSARGFSVKSCYDWLCDHNAGAEDFVSTEVAEACTKVWKNDVPSKAAILSWRIMLDTLATRSSLHRRGLLIYVVFFSFMIYIVFFVSKKRRQQHTYSALVKQQRMYGMEYLL